MSIRCVVDVRLNQKLWCNALVVNGCAKDTRRRHVVSVKNKESYIHVSSVTAVHVTNIAMSAALNLVHIRFAEIVSYREIL